MKKYITDYSYLLAIAGTVIALDQITKAIVRTQIPFGELWSPWNWLTPFARIVHWENSGAAFGMLQGFGGIFTVLAIVVSLAILYYFPQVPRGDWPLRLAMGLQLGGAVGNLIDRLTQGGIVTDFISVGNFPVFNVADASISSGVAILLVGMWWHERRTLAEEQKEAGVEAAPEPPAATPLEDAPSE